MKKVRFESPNKHIFNRMDDRECHFPRPCIEKQPSLGENMLQERLLLYNNDPIQRFETSNSSPYPIATKTQLPSLCYHESHRTPSSDLNLSMLDGSCHQPRPFVCRPTLDSPQEIPVSHNVINTAIQATSNIGGPSQKVLTAIENTKTLVNDNGFFIRRENFDKYITSANTFHNQLKNLNIDKENDPTAKKAEIIKTKTQNMVPPNMLEKPAVACPPVTPSAAINNDCNCHHCIRAMKIRFPHIAPPAPVNNIQNPCRHFEEISPREFQCACVQIRNCYCEGSIPSTYQCHLNKGSQSPQPKNAVDRKTWAVEKYEKSLKGSMDIEKQANVIKEKREPTVADLFKIIKLQNEQLQLLQEKVDKFISASSNKAEHISTAPVNNYVTENVALQTIDTNQHKISIGVMTSFEMVRTSTVINKEIVTTKENAQIQCNRSQISIKEVLSKSPENLNFLDGIMPNKTVPYQSFSSLQDNNVNNNATIQQSEMVNDEKTLNEFSLYNVQVDNATTPIMSPEQSMYLDVRDFSDSESTSSDDHSNVGWTYYNKVMTHVNGLLQDSDMPSSASALYRNTRQQCVQMQIDKTNVSVTKRVKFGDDPLGIHQPHIYAASTDTSLKMNQLAAKYLKTVPVVPQRHATRPTTTPIDISYATRNYMERHKLLQGPPVASTSPQSGEIPRFLDITALKKQPKLL